MNGTGKKIFRDYLKPEDSGPDVFLLQIILLAGGHNENIVPDGNYGEETKKGVVRMQEWLDISADGLFGLETQTALLQETGLNISGITSDFFVGETVQVINSPS